MQCVHDTADLASRSCTRAQSEHRSVYGMASSRWVSIADPQRVQEKYEPEATLDKASFT